jgi:hypothetical protein
MGLVDRFKVRFRMTGPIARAGPAPAQLRLGTEDLEVVGEFSYQDTLWAICGGRLGDRIRHEVTAVLIPEPGNPHDVNAILVRIDDRVVGYLPRDVAATYITGLHTLMTRCGGHIALRGLIVGGGHYDDGPGRLGVWLEHDPRDFGIPPARPGSPTGAGNTGMRTGLSEAWRTDLEDDSYDLSWLADLPEADVPAIARLSRLLQEDPDPIDRHFQFAELEARLYRARDVDEHALDEYDGVCRQHDAEMEVICEAFRQKWNKIPLLDSYRQMAIRQQKKKDWQSCLWWAERGLEIYGDIAARPDAVEDLRRRRARALTKLEPPSVTSVSRPNDGRPAAQAQDIATRLEVLKCSRCQASFERIRVRGRKPTLCPSCRS